MYSLLVNIYSYSGAEDEDLYPSRFYKSIQTKRKNDLQKWALVIECLRSLQVIFQRHFQPNELTAF